MKRILKLGVIGIFCLLLVGCNDTNTASRDYNPGEIVETSARLFQEVRDEGNKFLVYIGRPACPACARLFPTMEEIAEEYDINFYYVNLDVWNRDDFNRLLLPSIENFRGTPTILVMQGNEVIDEIVGAHPKENMIEFLERNDMI